VKVLSVPMAGIAPREKSMNELLAALMSWAVTLSGYPAPTHMPEVVMVSHQDLMHAACSDQECKVLGWFPPGEKIFLDKRLEPLDGTYSSAVVIHEMVHYLQQNSGRFSHARDRADCADLMEMEHQAYQVQRDFFLQYGVYQPVGVALHATADCTPAATGP
jgi:hypothetical protein